MGLLLSFLSSCATFRASAPVESREFKRAKTADSGRYKTYRVKRGDTLFSIAWRFRRDQKDVAAWNNLRSPFTIYPGQVLRLSNSPSVTKKKVTRKRVKEYRPSQKKEAVQYHKGVATTGKLKWRWPTKGKISRSYRSGRNEHNGIDVQGRLGQSILAAESGEVVYSGNKLVGYGNLIIIQHRKNYLSAYAHNKKLLVNVGRNVKKGQSIATMGRNSSGKPVLHFEIRRRGNPMNPVWQLPKR